jgi:hypothetical protein
MIGSGLDRPSAAGRYCQASRFHPGREDAIFRADFSNDMVVWDDSDENRGTHDYHMPRGGRLVTHLRAIRMIIPRDLRIRKSRSLENKICIWHGASKFR